MTRTLEAFRPRALAAAAVLVVALVGAGTVNIRAQPATRPAAPEAPSPRPVATEDKLGRATPRGTLRGFMAAARTGNHDVALLYLDTAARDKAAIALAHQLYVVLDSRLPARLRELSDQPEGSLTNPLKPDQDVLGTIQTADGPLQIVVERVSRDGAGPIWLFSRETLAAIPYAYAEEGADRTPVDRYLPAFLTRWRVAGIRLFVWLSFLLAVPLTYRLSGLPGPLFRQAIARWGHRYEWVGWCVNVLPGPVRLFALAFFLRWIVSLVRLPLLERRFWWVVQVVLALTAVAWLLLRLNAVAERYLRRTIYGSAAGEMAAILRLVRRVADVLVVAAAVIVLVRLFGFDPSAALAGLGIGGIAVALAAQKTLENVIGGLSIVFDKAVRVGDDLKLGDTIGKVDYVGLRSTRIRTPDRTVVSIPNGQIANVNIETLSARDKFRFLHVVCLRQDTTSAQMRAIVEGIRDLLAAYPDVDREVIRARFFRLGPFSLDIEVLAYINARSWERFLEIQQDLLMRILEIVERAGTAIALPSQTLVADARPAATVVR